MSIDKKIFGGTMVGGTMESALMRGMHNKKKGDGNNPSNPVELLKDFKTLGIVSEEKDLKLSEIQKQLTEIAGRYRGAEKKELIQAATEQTSVIDVLEKLKALEEKKIKKGSPNDDKLIEIMKILEEKVVKTAVLNVDDATRDKNKKDEEGVIADSKIAKPTAQQIEIKESKLPFRKIDIGPEDVKGDGIIEWKGKVPIQFGQSTKESRDEMPSGELEITDQEGKKIFTAVKFPKYYDDEIKKIADKEGEVFVSNFKEGIDRNNEKMFFTRLDVLGKYREQGKKITKEIIKQEIDEYRKIVMSFRRKNLDTKQAQYADRGILGFMLFSSELERFENAGSLELKETINENKEIKKLILEKEADVDDAPKREDKKILDNNKIREVDGDDKIVDWQNKEAWEENKFGDFERAERQNLSLQKLITLSRKLSKFEKQTLREQLRNLTLEELEVMQQEDVNTIGKAEIKRVIQGKDGEKDKKVVETSEDGKKTEEWGKLNLMELQALEISEDDEVGQEIKMQIVEQKKQELDQLLEQKLLYYWQEELNVNPAYKIFNTETKQQMVKNFVQANLDKSKKEFYKKHKLQFV